MIDEQEVARLIAASEARVLKKAEKLAAAAKSSAQNRERYTLHANEHRTGGRDVIPAASGIGAPTDATYLVTTAHASLSAEVAVGPTPGGELGNTWASPTVDATHSGSSHAATQAAAEATAAAAAATHAAAADPHAGYRLESADHSHVSTGLQGGVLYSLVHYVFAPDAAPGATIIAGDGQGNFYHSGPAAETATKLYVDAETAPGASGLPVTVAYGDTNDLDTVASWTTIATLTLSSEKSSSTTSMTNATIPADRLIRLSVGTIVGTPKDASITLVSKRPITT